MAPVTKKTNQLPPLTPTTINLSDDYPHELSSFLHGHTLTHMIRNTQVPSRTNRTCAVCHESIHGNFYQCKDCYFHVHSFCTRLPNSLRHVIDPKHKLCLYKISSGRCSVCKEDCSSRWIYGCSVCKVNIHLNCLRKPFGSHEKTNQPSSGNSRGIHHHAPPPWTPQPHFHGGVPGWGWYPNYNFGYHGHDQFAHNYNNNHNHHQVNHGGHGYGHGASTSSLILGSVMENAIVSLVGNLAMGSLTNFLFGSIGF